MRPGARPSAPSDGGALRALTRPAALLMHVPVLAVALVLASLGQWQLERLAQVRASNATLATRLAEPPVDLVALARRGPVDAAILEYRRVEVVGTFRPDEEVLQRNRQHRGRTGFDVLTPFDLGDGVTLLVRRGWIPPADGDPPIAGTAPPADVVRLTGVLERTVDQPTFGARDPTDGVLRRVFHPDTVRLDQQMSGRLLPVVLRLESPAPTTPAGLPLLPEPPLLDEGSHRSYAVQWHAFAVLALTAYAGWWWRRLGAPRGRLRRLTPP